MRNRRFFYILFFLALATAAGAQYLPGTLQGGPPAPGTKTRSPLNSLERAANNQQGATILTDNYGNQRFAYYVRVLDSADCILQNPITHPTIGDPQSAFVKICGTDSLFYIDWDRNAVYLGTANSSGGDTLNWYNSNDTTTNLLRTAFLLRSAWWRGLDSTGFWRFSIRPDGFDGTQVTGYQDSLTIDADTILWQSTWHPELQFHDLQADATYFYADSLKVVGIGQFPAFPDIAYNGTDKGLYYSPSYYGEVSIYNGLPSAQSYNTISVQGTQFYLESSNSATNREVLLSGNNTGAGFFSVEDPTSGLTRLSMQETGVVVDGWQLQNVPYDTGVTYILGYTGSIGNKNSLYLVSAPYNFAWFQNLSVSDTASNTLSFYNRAYYFPNARPSSTLGDSSTIVWIGDGVNAGKRPIFAPYTSGGGGGTNWYNSNGTTTDNTRIATVTETATWLSSDVQANGVFPFRFELAGESPNEPENMVWVFPSDSATLYQSDQELTLFSSNHWLLKANGYGGVQSDSFFYNPNLGGTAFKVGANNVVTQNAITGTPTHRDAIEYNTVTGTAQTELFLDGSSAVWVVPSNSAENFKIQVTAICSNAGNGVGISTGEVWTSWHVGGIKRISNTTSMVGSTQTIATAQADAGMASSVVTIDADDADDSLRIRFTPPTTAGTTTVIRATASIELIQTSY